MDEGALWMRCLSLSKQAPWRGPGGGSFFTGDPGRNVKKVSGGGHLSLWGPLYQGEASIGEGAHIQRTLIDE